MVNIDLRILLPAYLLTGPSIAIIEIAFCSVLIITICDLDRRHASNVYTMSIGFPYIRQFLSYSRGLSHVFAAIIVILSVVLSEYATSSSIISNQQTYLYANKSLLTSDTHHASLRNATENYASAFENSFSYKYGASVTANNALQHNAVDYNKPAAIGVLTKRSNNMSNAYINDTTKHVTTFT